MDFAVPADHRVKLKENEKKDKYLDLAWELKKLWNMKMTFIPVVIGALGTVTEGLVKGLEDLEIRGRVETIQLQHCWDRPEYWEAYWRLAGTCSHSNSSEKPSANAGLKNSKRSNNNRELSRPGEPHSENQRKRKKETSTRTLPEN